MESLIEFLNRRNKTLRGMLHLPDGATEQTPAPAVTFFHGFTGDRMESHWMFVKCARALALRGIASLRFDFFGSGESYGEFREMTLQGEVEDALDAVRFMRFQKEIDPERVGLCGLSLGGCVAACVAAAADARALVLWAAVAHTSILQEIAERLGWPSVGDDLYEYDARLVSGSMIRSAADVNPIVEIRRYKRPTLILHGGGDETVPPSHADDFLAASGASVKERVIIPGADHTFASAAWESEVIQRTVQWFSTHLAGPR